jgi:hypothetical protein
MRKGGGQGWLVRLALVGVVCVGLGVALPAAALAAATPPAAAAAEPTTPGPDAPLASNRSGRVAALATGAAAIALGSSLTISLVYRRRRRT